MRIDLERIRELEAERQRINAVPLANLEIYENGERIIPSAELLEHWRFIGMSNVTFLEMWPFEIKKV